MSLGKICAVRDLAEPFPELDAEISKRKCATAPNFDSPLLTVVESWLRADYDRSKAQARLNDKGVAMTKWDILSENMKVHFYIFG